MSNVIVYGTRYCPYCVAATQLLRAKGIEYNYVAATDNYRSLETYLDWYFGEFFDDDTYVGGVSGK